MAAAFYATAIFICAPLGTQQQKRCTLWYDQESAFYIYMGLSHFKNAVRNFYSHVRLSDNCIEDELRLIVRYLFRTGR